MRHLRILGSRGIPAEHGGFESFVQQLAPFLTQRGWRVTVYCQEDGRGEIREDDWCGIRRVIIPVKTSGALGTIVFDWKSVLHACREKGIALTLGYNTAVFSILFRLRGIRNFMNMDGIEWKRQKWGFPERAWLYFNERIGCFVANHLIADHPEISSHLSRCTNPRKISMIPYSADRVHDVVPRILDALGIVKRGYALIVARPEPENSILEMVSAFEALETDKKLVVLGDYRPDENAYHRKVIDAASDKVVFAGPIYAKSDVQALRSHAWMYFHGHTVGGTNPSLVEALGCGCAILAHGNRYNRWVAEDAAVYFSDAASCIDSLNDSIAGNMDLQQMRDKAYARHSGRFTHEIVLTEYEAMLLKH